jgi:flagellar protein FlgJ
MDQQVALDLARNGGFGFGKLLIDQLSPQSDAASTGLVPLPARPSATGHFPSGLPATMLPPGVQGGDAAALRNSDARGADPREFVARLLPDATAAARKLGVEPRLLLAQAALETGWGESAPRHADGAPTNNLFGIKASGSWQGASATAWTMENVDGVAERKRESFRAYADSSESFTDYANLIASSPRYQAALEQAHDPAGYVRAVADAGYATDPQYAQKWLAIYHGDRLSGALQGLKHGAAEPTK